MKKKNRKLMFQVFIIVLPVFILMLLAIIWAMYNTNVNGFLEAQNSRMKMILKRIDENIIYTRSSELAWYFARWKEYPEMTVQPTTQEEERLFTEHIDDDDIWELEWMESSSEPIRNYCIKTRYDNMLSSLQNQSSDQDYDRVFVMDITPGNEGFVFCEQSNEGEQKTLGYRYEFDIEEHPGLRSFYDGTSPGYVFERDDDFPKNGSYYIGYKPIITDEGVIAVLGIAYRWDDFQVTLYGGLLKTAFISIGALAAALAVLILVLYFKAIRPLAKIQRSVRDYINNKDSAAVISRMSEIRERNEFGLHADNISMLVKEIDYYNEENVRLAGERERVAAELDMARDIQASQLPRQFPAFPGRDDFDIFASMTPAKEVGGDFYDFFLIDDDHLALTIADVSGKGVPAALFMMASKMLIRNYAEMGLSPAEVIGHTNERICQSNTSSMFVTVWYGVLELSTGRVTAVNAGHEYPVIKHPDGSFELFRDKHNFIVGALSGRTYKGYEFTLEKGSTLFLYTDGVPEATDAAEEMFGTDRLVDALNSCPGDTPEQLLEHVRCEVNRFVGDAPQFDDLTMLCVKLK